MPLFGGKSKQATPIRRKVGDDVHDSSPSAYTQSGDLSGRENHVQENDVDRGRAAAIRPRGYFILSRQGAFFSLFGLLLVIVWVFILGIFVGRGTIFETRAFQQLETRLTGTPAPKAGPLPAVEVNGTPQPSKAEKSGDVKPEPDLTFYNSLEKSKQDPLKPEPKITPKVVTAPPPPAANIPTVAPTPASAPPPPKKTKQEKQPEKSSPVVTSGVKTVTPEQSAAPPPDRRQGENFTVQVSAASTVDKAEAAVDRLKAKGYDAYYYQVELKGRQYFRVRVGRYSSKQEAQMMLQKLAEAGHVNMFISALTD